MLALFALLVASVSVPSESQSISRTAEGRTVVPCKSDCDVNYWTGNGTYYCYPGGEWQCPLFGEDDPLGAAR